MSLQEYYKKRNFEKTSEPKEKNFGVNKKRFVVQEHYASNHHFDFRLEMQSDYLEKDIPNGRVVLKSWAIPKYVPQNIGDKKLAIQTEDHPVEYINFEGGIPKGEYGAGLVMIWDKGNYEIISKSNNSLKIKIEGKKITGEYALVKINFSGKDQWLFFKIL